MNRAIPLCALWFLTLGVGAQPTHAASSALPSRSYVKMGGEQYDPIGQLTFYTFRPSVTDVPEPVTGYLTRYQIATEKDTPYPVAEIDLTRRSGEIDVLFVAQPTTINGEVFACKGPHHSEFARLFRVCESFPPSLLGPCHPVTIMMYRAAYLLKSEVYYATNAIRSVAHPNDLPVSCTAATRPRESRSRLPLRQSSRAHRF